MCLNCGMHEKIKGSDIEYARRLNSDNIALNASALLWNFSDIKSSLNKMFTSGRARITPLQHSNP